MDQEVIWALADGPGMEHLLLTWDDESVHADGVIILRSADRTVRTRYLIWCDAEWRVREVRLDSLDRTQSSLHLLADGRGQWSTGDGQPLQQLEGCIDVDLWGVACTNTLPIRRLRLQPGESAEIAVAYVSLISHQITREHQRYSALEKRMDGATYRFDDLGSTFTAEIAVDSHGLIVSYPGVGARVWPARDL